jgi:hypothetical protein
MLDSLKMERGGLVHKLGDLVDGEGDVKASEREILEAYDKAVIRRWVTKWITREEGKRVNSGHWSLDWLSIRHVTFVEEIKYVTLLGENESFRCRDGFNTEKEMKRS